MAGDYTRLTFDPRKHLSAVLMQQGRVQLDSDWNELVELLTRRLRAETADVVGLTGTPSGTPDGFDIQLAGSSFRIGRGRMYVDGLLAENHGRGAAERDSVLDELRGAEAVPYESQPYFPDAGVREPVPAGGPHLVYLDVWEREVSALEAPDLIDPAVGVDTATRRQTAWRVRVLADMGAAFTCATLPETVTAWQELTRPSAGRLTTAPAPVTEDFDPCTVAPNGGYRGRENRLYRVEIHRDGALGAASFKWSRDNGSIATRVRQITDRTLTVDRIGRDRVLRFEAGTILELTDDRRELDGRPGLLLTVQTVDEATGEILLTSAVPAGEFGATRDELAARHTRIRRWDQPTGAATGAVPVPAGGAPIVLEHGVQITFGAEPAGGELKSGDYWVFAARTADGSVERLAAAPPRGLHHHYAPLAVVTFPSTIADCRQVFRPLTEIDPTAGSCTITVRPWQNLQRAIDDLPAGGGRICLVAGTYALDDPVTAANRRRIVVSGAGPATILRATQTETALAFTGCSEVEVRGLRVEGATEAGPGRARLDGALTFVGCRDVVVAECVLACPDAVEVRPGDVRRGQTCLTFRSGSTDPQDRVRVERCRFEVGALQTAVLLVDPGRAVVAENRVVLASAPAPPPGAAAAPAPVRAGGQGIVVAGNRVGSIQIVDNVVEDVIQGIHVGVSHAAAPGREAAGDVLLSRNVVHLLVPANHRRDRHAVFVGNTRSAHVKDTIATLRRIGPPPPGGLATPVEGLRIHGALGPFLSVSQTSLQGFGPVGISVLPLEPQPPDRMWVVSETMAQGAARGVKAPPSVSQERNRPLPPATITLVASTTQTTAGTRVSVGATVRNAENQPVASVPVRFSVSGANSAAAAVLTNAAGQAAFAYVPGAAGIDAIRAYADADGDNVRAADEPQAGPVTVTVVPAGAGTATALALTPKSGGSKTAGSQHCVTARVTDSTGAPVGGVTVRFSVSGANPGGAALTTNASGDSVFCYTGSAPGGDTIVAFADVNGNDQRDAGEPQDSAGVTFNPVPLVPVPDVLGMSPTAAAEAISGAQLTVGTVTTLPPPPKPRPGFPFVVWILGPPPPKVVEQSPERGSRVPVGTVVDLAVQRDWEKKP